MVGNKAFMSLVFLMTCLSITPSDLMAKELVYGVVTNVIDGDSLHVTTPKKEIQIRLYGVDAPEYTQPSADAAKRFIEKTVKGKRVSLEPQYTDSYGRMVAVVFNGSETLNDQLVQAGLAWVSPKYCQQDYCDAWKKKEKMAQLAKKGIWQESEPIPPWVWKRKKRAE